MTRKVAVLALFLLACSTGTEGAVSFRWRIVDQCTGNVIDIAQHTDHTTGACSCTAGSGDCPTYSWIVHTIRLVVSADQHFDFPCKQREATTAFQIKEGEYPLSIEALQPGDDAGPDCQEAITPPPLVRSVINAQITNLDVIQIGVFDRTTCGQQVTCL
jgi:hypothetical protein